MPAPSNDQLYKTLSELKVIDQNKLDSALQQSQANNSLLGNILIEKDLISDENLGKVQADLLEVPFVKLADLTIEEQFLRLVPESVARHNKVIAFKKDNKGLYLAMADPTDTEMVKLIGKKSGLKINICYSTDRDIDYALRLYENNIQQNFDSLLKNQLTKADKSSTEIPIPKVVDLLIEDAYSNRASDIHIEPEENKTVIRFRVDGVLHEVLTIPKSLHEQIVSRIKVLAKLRIDEHLSAQDGKMQVKMPEEELDIRVSVVPITNGENVVLRLLSSYSRQFGLSDLGMGENDLSKVKNGFNKPYGMVLSTGPTGSGKTTTIYSILKIVNTREKNIATIEDPVEYEIEGINQIQANPKTNLTFAEGLRSILRQDPDIMFVGEIRDNETAGIAINSAMTGHLVLSTLHTNDAPTTLPRLIDMGIEPFLVASTVNVIIGQRLVRKICGKCRYSTEWKFDGKKWKNDKGEENLHLTALNKELITKHFEDKPLVRLYAGKGCAICHQTGYNGRIGVFEVLEVTDPIRALISAKADAEAIQKKALEEGMTTMLDDGLEKAAKGITTVEEIMRATKE